MNVIGKVLQGQRLVPEEAIKKNRAVNENIEY
jgi:hypothetical protein